MALKKQIQSEQGVVAEYWRVLPNVQINVAEKWAICFVAPYASEAFRRQKEHAVVVFHPHELDAVRPALRLVGGEFDEAIKTGDVRPAVYAKLKALDVFAGAEDV